MRHSETPRKKHAKNEIKLVKIEDIEQTHSLRSQVLKKTELERSENEDNSTSIITFVNENSC